MIFAITPHLSPGLVIVFNILLATKEEELTVDNLEKCGDTLKPLPSVQESMMLALIKAKASHLLSTFPTKLVDDEAALQKEKNDHRKLIYRYVINEKSVLRALVNNTTKK